MTRPLPIVTACADEALRARCRELLESAEKVWVVDEAEDGLRTIETVQRVRPRIVVIDFSLFPEDMPSLIHVLRAKSPVTRVLVLVKEDDAHASLDALAAGARGYLRHEDLDRFLVLAVRKIDDGEAWVPRTMVSKVLDRLCALSRVETAAYGTNVQ